MSITISRNNGELRVDETLGSFADLDRLVFALYHAGFLLWPKEVAALAEAGKIGGSPPATMRAALTPGYFVDSETGARVLDGKPMPAKAPEKPAGGPLRSAAVMTPAPKTAAAPATARGYVPNPGGKAHPVTVDGVKFASKGAAIRHCFVKGGRTDMQIAMACETTPGAVYTARRDFRAAQAVAVK